MFSEATHRLQPMHSRMSSLSPSSIFLGRKGSAIDGRADEIGDAAVDLRDHRIRRGEPPDRHDRFVGLLLDEGDVGFLEGFVREARGCGIVGPVADVHVPQVRQVGEHLDHRLAFLLPPDAVLAAVLVDGKSQRDSGLVADCFLGVLQQLADQPRAVLDAAAIFVGPVIGVRREEMLRQRDVVACVDVDDVVANADSAFCRLDLPTPKLLDIGLVHLAAHDRVPIVMDRVGGGAKRDLLGLAVGKTEPVVDQLHGGQRAMLVHRVHPTAKLLRIVVIPQSPLTIGCSAGTRMNAALLGADHGPTALGLHLPMGDVAVMLGVAHRVAVRHLIEAVLGDLGADLDRREEHVVAGVASH